MANGEKYSVEENDSYPLLLLPREWRRRSRNGTVHGKDDCEDYAPAATDYNIIHRETVLGSQMTQEKPGFLLSSIVTASASLEERAQVKSESHLQSHGHLTNNIHLRNLVHMQRQRVLMEARNSSELPLMKELTVLRRARSLRDPSTSPAWSNSSYGGAGSRRLHGNVKRDEAHKLSAATAAAGGAAPAAGSANRRDLRRLNLRDNADGKREKLDLRVGGRHWVGDFLGEDAVDDHQNGMLLVSDQKENQVLESNGLRGVDVSNHQVLEDAKSHSKGGSNDSSNANSNNNNKKGRRLDKSRSYPRGGSNNSNGHIEDVAEDEQQSQRKSGRSSDQHSERENMPDGSILGERVQRGSIRVVDSGGWMEEPERRAEIARRVISETVNNRKLAGEDRDESDTALSSPAFAAPKSAHSTRDHSDSVSVMDLGDPGSGRDNNSEEEISLRNGLKQLPSSMSSHAHSPLLYRDSMIMAAASNERSASTTPRGGRRKAPKTPGSRDGDRRHREGINVRVVGKAQGRLRGGRRSGLRHSFSPRNAVGGSSANFSMEGELEVSELPRNGCGIPWYWNRMQKYNRGRKFLDLAGKSLACGFTENSKSKDRGSNSNRDLTIPSTEYRSFYLDRSGGGRIIFPDRSSDFDLNSRFSIASGGESPDEEIPRADGNLLDRSGELIFGSTRQDLSGVLISSPTCGIGSPGPPPVPSMHHSHHTSGEVQLSLSQKYRPRNFGELVGQTIISKSLSTAILKGKVAPVYLFQGPRGTGKTSAARIFAKALNCVSDSAEQSRPCGFCGECTSSSPHYREFDATSNNGVDSVKTLLGSMAGPSLSSRCRVFIIDDCHLLTTEAWNAFMKALEKPPWHVVFILITTDAEKIPRNAVSRCQKFLFSKVKESDIVSRLQVLAGHEGLEVEDAALALVASRSQGSLGDAETTLDQLSLLGKKVSLSMVQEMAGLISDEKLIDLLDLAMSAEAVSTVRCMRELLDGGVEPLALVSQLATLITDILAGTYVVSREKLMRGYFFRRISRKEEAVRLRQALRILSEAEKQLRLSSDQPTWLTAALLQFAPDRSFQPSSIETSVAASPIAAFHDTSEKETVGESVQPWTSEEQVQFLRESSKGEVTSRREHSYPPNFPDRRKKNGTSSFVEAKVHPAESPLVTGIASPDERPSARPSNARSDTPLLPGNIEDMNQKDFTVMSQRKLEEAWQRVLQGSRSNVLRQLLQGQGKLLSLLRSDAFAVAHLEFRHPEHKARAERSRSRICNAFQMALGCPVELQITLACMPGEQQLSFTSFEDQTQMFDGWSKEKGKLPGVTPDRRPFDLKSSSLNRRRQRNTRSQRPAESMEIPQSLYNAVMGDSKGFKPEILPVVSSSKWGRHGGPGDCRHEELSESKRFAASAGQDLRHSENHQPRYGPSSALANRTASGKVPLKTVIHQFEDTLASPNQDLQTDILCGSGSRRKTVKFRDVNSGHTASLEQQNLRLETRLKPSQTESRLRCWRVQKLDEEKIKVHRRRRQRRVRFLLKLVPCAKSRTNPQQPQTT